MELLPDTTLGNFFNEQHRETGTYQVIATISGSKSTRARLAPVQGRHRRAAQHVRRIEPEPAGADRTRRRHARADADVHARARRRSRSATTDVALFAQDRYQPNARWYVEFGGRVDRDGVLDRFNVTPRVGTAVVLDKAGVGRLRGGLRSVLRAHAVDRRRVRHVPERRRSAVPAGRRHAARAAGHVQRRPSAASRRRAAARGTSASTIASTPCGRCTSACSIGRVRDELIVDPDPDGAQRPDSCCCRAAGSSSYLGRRSQPSIFRRASSADVNVSYTRSRARADLNALSNYFDTVMWPVLGRTSTRPRRPTRRTACSPAAGSCPGRTGWLSASSTGATACRGRRPPTRSIT